MLPLSFWLESLDTPTGPILIVTDDQGAVRAVDWEENRGGMFRLLRKQYDAGEMRQTSEPSPVRRSLQAYFEGDLDALSDLKTAAMGTGFQHTVWQALRRIPVGTTTTYGALAARIGRPAAARAVGLANGANPIPIIVPCHRVIGANASLTGFGGGLERKRWLLAHERALPASCRRSAFP